MLKDRLHWSRIFILIWAAVHQSSAVNLQTMCRGHPYGTLLPNPQDCGSYYVCDSELQLVSCDLGLHFDRINKVCNWPFWAKCKLDKVDDTNLDEMDDKQVLKYEGNQPAGSELEMSKPEKEPQEFNQLEKELEEIAQSALELQQASQPDEGVRENIHPESLDVELKVPTQLGADEAHTGNLVDTAEEPQQASQKEKELKATAIPEEELQQATQPEEDLMQPLYPTNQLGAAEGDNMPSNPVNIVNKAEKHQQTNSIENELTEGAKPEDELQQANQSEDELIQPFDSEIPKKYLEATNQLVAVEGEQVSKFGEDDERHLIVELSKEPTSSSSKDSIFDITMNEDAVEKDTFSPISKLTGLKDNIIVIQVPVAGPLATVQASTSNEVNNLENPEDELKVSVATPAELPKLEVPIVSKPFINSTQIVQVSVVVSGELKVPAQLGADEADTGNLLDTAEEPQQTSQTKKELKETSIPEEGLQQVNQPEEDLMQPLYPTNQLGAAEGDNIQSNPGDTVDKAEELQQANSIEEELTEVAMPENELQQANQSEDELIQPFDPEIPKKYIEATNQQVAVEGDQASGNSNTLVTILGISKLGEDNETHLVVELSKEATSSSSKDSILDTTMNEDAVEKDTFSSISKLTGLDNIIVIQVPVTGPLETVQASTSNEVNNLENPEDVLKVSVAIPAEPPKFEVHNASKPFINSTQIVQVSVVVSGELSNVLPETSKVEVTLENIESVKPSENQVSGIIVKVPTVDVVFEKQNSPKPAETQNVVDPTSFETYSQTKNIAETAKPSDPASPLFVPVSVGIKPQEESALEELGNHNELINSLKEAGVPSSVVLEPQVGEKVDIQKLPQNPSQVIELQNSIKAEVFGEKIETKMQPESTNKVIEVVNPALPVEVQNSTPDPPPGVIHTVVAGEKLEDLPNIIELPSPNVLVTTQIPHVEAVVEKVELSKPSETATNQVIDLPSPVLPTGVSNVVLDKEDISGAVVQAEAVVEKVELSKPTASTNQIFEIQAPTVETPSVIIENVIPEAEVVVKKVEAVISSKPAEIIKPPVVTEKPYPINLNSVKQNNANKMKPVSYSKDNLLAVIDNLSESVELKQLSEGDIFLVYSEEITVSKNVEDTSHLQSSEDNQSVLQFNGQSEESDASSDTPDLYKKKVMKPGHHHRPTWNILQSIGNSPVSVEDPTTAFEEDALNQPHHSFHNKNKVKKPSSQSVKESIMNELEKTEDPKSALKEHTVNQPHQSLHNKEKVKKPPSQPAKELIMKELEKYEDQTSASEEGTLILPLQSLHNNKEKEPSPKPAKESVMKELESGTSEENVTNFLTPAYIPSKFIKPLEPSKHEEEEEDVTVQSLHLTPDSAKQSEKKFMKPNHHHHPNWNNWQTIENYPVSVEDPTSAFEFEKPSSNPTKELIVWESALKKSLEDSEEDVTHHLTPAYGPTKLSKLEEESIENQNMHVESLDGISSKPVIHTTNHHLNLIVSVLSKPTFETTESADEEINRQIIGAHDTETGIPIDVMKGYDSRNVQCIHDGLYFLPHPNSCVQYFICAYRHLHLHTCGSDLIWNYKREQCELETDTRCYSNEAKSLVKPTPGRPNIPSKDEVSSSTKPPAWHPMPPVRTTQITEDAFSKDSLAPICPSIRQVYMPNYYDCNKYYICILGEPVLTSCPDYLHWDSVGEFCGKPSLVQCARK